MIGRTTIIDDLNSCILCAVGVDKTQCDSGSDCSYTALLNIINNYVNLEDDLPLAQPLSPSDGDVLTYIAADSKWEAKAPAGLTEYILTTTSDQSTTSGSAVVITGLESVTLPANSRWHISGAIFCVTAATSTYGVKIGFQSDQADATGHMGGIGGYSGSGGTTQVYASIVGIGNLMGGAYGQYSGGGTGYPVYIEGEINIVTAGKLQMTFACSATSYQVTIKSVGTLIRLTRIS